MTESPDIVVKALINVQSIIQRVNAFADVQMGVTEPTVGNQLPC